MFKWMRYHLDYDQMIWEFGDDKNPAWIHVSYVTHRENRKKLTRQLRFFLFKFRSLA